MAMKTRLLFTCIFILNLAVALAGDATHIYGIHDWGSGANGLFNGKSRWDVETIRVGIDAPTNLPQINNEGFTLILRLGKGWGESVPRSSSEWDSFAASCASTVCVYTTYSKRFIIGNEFNANFDANIPASSYIQVYNKCYTAIKSRAPEVEVIMGAVAPYNASNNPGGPYSYAWLNYFYTMVTAVGNNCDGYAIHAYGGRLGDADPRDDNYYAFGVYKDWMGILALNYFTSQKPVYLTEMNCFIDGFGTTTGYPKYPYSAGWINKAYEDINNWNTTHSQKIQCACWFAYTNGGFPGYDLTLVPQASSDFSFTTQNTNYLNRDPLSVPSNQWSILE